MLLYICNQENGSLIRLEKIKLLLENRVDFTAFFARILCFGHVRAKQTRVVATAGIKVLVLAVKQADFDDSASLFKRKINKSIMYKI